MCSSLGEPERPRVARHGRRDGQFSSRSSLKVSRSYIVHHSSRPPTSTSETYRQTSQNSLWVSSSLSVGQLDRFVSLSSFPDALLLRPRWIDPFLLFLRSQVKVMYPRLDDPRSTADASQLGARRVGIRAGLSGFVAYMKRESAERAIKDFDGLDWGGSVLKVGWSKAVPIPRLPVYGEYLHPACLLGLAKPFNELTAFLLPHLKTSPLPWTAAHDLAPSRHHPPRNEVVARLLLPLAEAPSEVESGPTPALAQDRARRRGEEDRIFSPTSRSSSELSLERSGTSDPSSRTI